MAKLTTDSFKTNLKEGKYSSAGGARKALGKAQEISKADKATLASSIDKHFGASATPAKAATKAPAKAAKKTAAKKTARKGATKTAKTAAKKTARAPKASGSSSPGAAPRDGGNELADAARDLITYSVDAMNAINGIHAPGVESAPVLEALQDRLNHGTKVLGARVTQLENANKEQAAEPAPAKTRAPRMAKAPEATKSTANGASDKSAADFEDSLPGSAEA